MEYSEYRRHSRKVRVGDRYIGGDAEITVQSMTNVPSSDFPALLTQMRQLQDAGCDIIRMTVPDCESARNISRLKESGINVPIVADIHFNYRLAIESAAAGAQAKRPFRKWARSCLTKSLPRRAAANSRGLKSTGSTTTCASSIPRRLPDGAHCRKFHRAGDETS